MKNIHVVSMGPGSGEYILPAARDAIAACDVIAGGKRILESIDTSGKEVLAFEGGVDAVCALLHSRENRKIAVLVSGDAGFYSFLKRLTVEFGREKLHVIPGISPIHYLLAALGLGWEDTAFLSLHGRNTDFIPVIEKHGKTALLTDRQNTPQKIAGELVAHNLGELLMYIGNRLSYPDEEIIEDRAKNIALRTQEFSLAVVVVVYA